MTTRVPVSKYLARLRLEYPLHTDSGVYNGYLTELRRRYKDNTGKVMEWVSFSGGSRVKPDPSSTEPFVMNRGEFLHAVSRIVRERQLVSACLLEILDIAIDLRREATRLHIARDTKDLGHKSAETISHEWFTENVLVQARTRLEKLEVVRCVAAKLEPTTPPLQFRNTYKPLDYFEEKSEVNVKHLDLPVTAWNW
jgi:hypothetical protein